jgi:hypothetical protein
MLPDGLEFLKPGWWWVHSLAILFVYVWAFQARRAAERRRQRASDSKPASAEPRSRFARNATGRDLAPPRSCARRQFAGL